MTIFDAAIAMEHEVEAYYRQMSERINLPGIKNIFIFLANEEVRHADLLKLVSKGSKVKLPDSHLLSDVQAVFKEFKTNPPVFNVNRADFEVYEHALDLERRSEAYYRTEAAKSSSKEIQAIFNQIADEENRHVFLLEHLKNYASRPHQWVEDAEFNHLDMY